MKLGMIAPARVESFEQAKRLQLDFIEFCLLPDDSASELAQKAVQLRRAAQLADVSVASTGIWGVPTLGAEGILPGPYAKAIQLIEAAAQIECPIVVIGVNRVEGLEFAANCELAASFYEQLIEYAGKYGVRIASGNCAWHNFNVEPAVWSRIHGKLPELGIKYDPSHARYAGRDYLQELRDWGDRVCHFHLKGSLIIGGERYDDPPAGLDQTDWPSVMAVLYSKGYKGGLSIEPHSNNWDRELELWGIEYTARYIRRMIAG